MEEGWGENVRYAMGTMDVIIIQHKYKKVQSRTEGRAAIPRSAQSRLGQACATAADSIEYTYPISPTCDEDGRDWMNRGSRIGWEGECMNSELAGALQVVCGARSECGMCVAHRRGPN